MKDVSKWIFANPENDPASRWDWYEDNVPSWTFERPSDEIFQEIRKINDPHQWVDSHLEEI